MLVQNNAGTAVIDNPEIPAKYHEAVIQAKLQVQSLKF